MAYDIGPKIGIEGEKEFRDAIKNIDTNLKTLGTEMMAVTSQYDKNDKSSDALTAQNKVLNKQIDEQKNKLSELQKGLEASAEKYGENDKVTQGWRQAVNKATADLNNMQRELDNNTKSLEELGNQSEKTNTLLSKEDAVNNIKNMSKALLALGASALAMAGTAVKSFNNVQVASNKLQTQTGATDKEMQEFNKSMKNIYANNLGESFEDIAQAMAEVRKQTGLTSSELEKATQNALILRDTFGFEVNESTRAANMLMKQFGMTGEEAFNLIAQGAQAGLDKNGDLLDSINEYSVHFEQLGLDGEEMFNVLKMGSENGAFSIDKVGDAFKEFGIRVKDGSETTSDAFTILGLNAKDMTSAFSAGGDKAQKAYYKVYDALERIKDPVKQNAAGVALFGTMWEDLGAKATLAAMGMSDEFNGAIDTMNKINKIRYNDFGSALTGIGRQLQVEFIMPIGEKLLPLLNDFASSIKGANGDIGKIIEGASTFVTALVGGIVQNMPAMIETGKTILTNLINGLTEALPQIIPVGISIITNLADKIISNIGTVVDMGIKLILALVQGIVSQFPILIQEVPRIINDFSNAIYEQLPKILKAGIDIILMLIKGLIDSIPTLVANIPQIIMAIVNVITLYNWANLGKTAITKLGEGIKSMKSSIGEIAKNTANGVSDAITGVFNGGLSWGKNLISNIGNGFSSMSSFLSSTAKSISNSAINSIKSVFSGGLDIGKNLIKGIWEGISSVKEWILEKIGGFAGTIIGETKAAFGIHSPSRVFRDEVGKNLALGLGLGFTDEMKKVSNDITGSIPTSFKTELGTSSSNNLGSLTETSNQRNIIIQFIAEGKKLAEVIAPYSDIIQGNNLRLAGRGMV
ncbi:phage tail tape measure protein [Clostridium sp. BSD9I1]|uniref:phage tail tape measure protein n=1 Tax=Clostridium sp. BSD9I1 TaxID=2003589 RepID=UPI001649193E|nr:phage tail tape measure protein [Clostridium sp. BSD9I1]